MASQAIFCINRRFIANRRYIGELSLIFWRFFEKNRPSDISRNIVSLASDTRYIDDISSIFHDIFFLDHTLRLKIGLHSIDFGKDLERMIH